MARHLPTDEIVDLYVNQKMKIYQLATRYNCSEFTIKNRLIKKGVYIKKTYAPIPQQHLQLILDIFEITRHYLNFVRRECNIDVEKLYELVTSNKQLYEIREDFYNVFHNEDIADLWWDKFCDWWYEKYDNN